MPVAARADRHHRAVILPARVRAAPRPSRPPVGGRCTPHSRGKDGNAHPHRQAQRTVHQFNRLRQSPTDIRRGALKPLLHTPDAGDADDVKAAMAACSRSSALHAQTVRPQRLHPPRRARPALVRRAALPALEEICAQLRHGARMDAQSVRDEGLKTVACKAAHQGRHRRAESCCVWQTRCAPTVKYCPHGRLCRPALTPGAGQALQAHLFERKQARNALLSGFSLSFCYLW